MKADDISISLKSYKPRSSAYVRLIFGRFASSRWYVFALVVLPFAVLSLFDTRFIYVALIALFMVIPMLLAFVYYYYALSEECVFSVRRGDAVIDSEGIARTFCDDFSALGKRTYKWFLFSRYECDGNNVILYLKSKKMPFIVIPVSELSPGALALLFVLLDEKLSGNSHILAD